MLLGVAAGDDEADGSRLARKVAALRIFENAEGKFDRSLLDTGGAGPGRQPVHAARPTPRRETGPSFTGAARPELAEPLYERFCAELRALGVTVATGVFGASMEVELVNDGPVTIVLET